VKLTILGAPVTKSNSQRIFRGKGGRPHVAQSAAYVAWECSALAQLACLPLGPRTTIPVSLRATFYRAKRTGDLGNFLKALCDVIERAGIVENDRLIVSFDGCRLAHDKVRPRVEFEVTEFVEEAA
jgi:Holliday junction resolvase RusA-like endonuclease